MSNLLYILPLQMLENLHIYIKWEQHSLSRSHRLKDRKSLKLWAPSHAPNLSSCGWGKFETGTNVGNVCIILHPGNWRDKNSKECVLTLSYFCSPLLTSGAQQNLDVTVKFSDYKSCFISGNPNSSPSKHLKEMCTFSSRGASRGIPDL